MKNEKNGKKGRFQNEQKHRRKKSAVPVLLGIVLVLLIGLLCLIGILYHQGAFQPDEQVTVPSGSETEVPGTEDIPQDTSSAEETTPREEETMVPDGSEPQTQTEPRKDPGTVQTDPPQAEIQPGDEEVVDAYINEDMHLILVLRDGTEIDKGLVGGNTEAPSYAVTFTDYDGTVLKSEYVKSGSNATPPANPVREGYTFVGWDGSYTNVTTNVTVVAQYRENAPSIVLYTVTFVDGMGNTLKTQVVEQDNSATAPVAPDREGFRFAGWVKAFDRVTSDLTVTAQYEPIPQADPTLYVGSVKAGAGERVQVEILVKNNPGIAGARFFLTYDERLTLTEAAPGEAFNVLDYTAPAALVNSCAFNWDSLDAESGADGVVLTLTFTAPADAAAGDTYLIKLSARTGDIYNVDLNEVVLAMESGTITIE